MKALITITVILVGIFVLWRVADYGVSVKAVPSLSEYFASTTAQMKYATENQASVATWLASSSVVDTLLSESTTTSSKELQLLQRLPQNHQHQIATQV